ncbi:hypothetical protein QOT17_013954 [Balamuthia mandrillaris]
MEGGKDKEKEHEDGNAEAVGNDATDEDVRAPEHTYDPAPLCLLNELASNNQLPGWTILQHPQTQLFYGSLDFKGQRCEVGPAKVFTKKKVVQAHLASVWLKDFGTPAAAVLPKASTSQPLQPSPFAALHNYLAKKKQINNFDSGSKRDETQVGYVYYCHLKLENGCVLKEEKGPFSSIAIAKHEAAKAMLERLATKDQDAWHALKSCLAQRVFIRGTEMEEDEDDRNEFKGGKKPDQEWNCEHACNMLVDKIGMNKKSLAAYVCGFLNTGKGGNIWYGIHDTKTIHGIKLSSKELDKVKLVIQQELRFLWPPISDDSEVIDIWHELIAPSSTDKYYLLQVEVRPGVRLGQTTWAKKMVWQKRGNMLIALEPEEIVQRLHKEWTKEE